MRGFLFAFVVLLTACGGGDQDRRDGELRLLNVSYDPTRELYREFNDQFIAKWLADTGQRVSVQMSHGGSGSQARAVIDGLNADVVTLALAWDIDNIQSLSRRLPASWQSRLPNNSSPYTSTIVFLVRKGNPKGIHDWPDLVNGDVQIITPNPKTSGGARWNYLAAWGFALDRALGGNIDELKSLPADKVAAAEAEAEKFVGELYRRVPVQDTGARAATNTFVQRKIGDVLLAWENEALLAQREMGSDAFDIVWPSVSVLAEPPVALIDSVVDRKGTRAVAEAYLDYLYAPEGQDIIARNFFRPTNAEVAARYTEQFPEIRTFTVDAVFGGWARAQAEHFADGGIFDRLFLAASGAPYRP
ncbi:MAG TPA: sulfate ABC transporter substrate-binding protein [Gammaproteobacteria bacterium]|nr:sulfate ABC transporter substrate-binding protein [Gammaproteobacteria bacterium]